jgi:SOS-response transcriptional repressor LexA
MANALRRSPRELGYRGVQVLALIRKRIETQGCSPTTHEIMKELAFYDRAGVCRVIRALEKRALIRRAGRRKVRGRTVLRLIVNNN